MRKYKGEAPIVFALHFLLSKTIVVVELKTNLFALTSVS